MSRLSALGPLTVILAWCAAGGWNSAGPEPRLWLEGCAVVTAALILPLPGTPARPRLLSDLRTPAWIALAGLLLSA